MCDVLYVCRYVLTCILIYVSASVSAFMGVCGHTCSCAATRVHVRPHMSMCGHTCPYYNRFFSNIFYTRLFYININIIINHHSSLTSNNTPRTYLWFQFGCPVLKKMLQLFRVQFHLTDFSPQLAPDGVGASARQSHVLKPRLLPMQLHCLACLLRGVW